MDRWGYCDPLVAVAKVGLKDERLLLALDSDLVGAVVVVKAVAGVGSVGVVVVEEIVAFPSDLGVVLMAASPNRLSPYLARLYFHSSPLCAFLCFRSPVRPPLAIFPWASMTKTCPLHPVAALVVCASCAGCAASSTAKALSNASRTAAGFW